MSQGGLTIRLLGPLTVERDGVPVALPQSRKARALLAYLVATRRAHRRDRLVSMFWEVPDDPRGALRWTLTKLRHVVDDEDCKRIVADRETVAFEPYGAACDLAQVRALLDARTHSADIADMEASIALFRGEFLEGLDLADADDFHAWCIAERTETRAMETQLLELLRDRLRDEPERALAYARRLVEIDPWDESARVALVRLLFATGRRPEAEEQYRLGSRRLDERGGPGAAELRRVWLELRDAPPSAAAPARRSFALVADPERDPGRLRWDTEGFQETADLLSRPAVAVLPFTNLSDEPGQDYFSDGITEDVITALCNWRWFPVIARNSTFAYKGRSVDVPAVGQDLGARYVVEGSVRRAGDRIRVTAQLSDAESGHHLWAQRFDGELGDVFALQDEMAAQIVTRIEPQIARAERRRADRKPPQQLDAWDLNLRALAHIYRATRDDFEAADALLARSVSLDPDFSYTHSLRALCLYHQALLGWIDDPVACSGMYLEIARRAVELDETDWLGHALLSMSVLWNLRDYETAAEEAKRAVDLNPSAAIAHQFVGCVRNFDGNPSDAIPHLHAAIRLNPHRETVTLLFADLALSHLLIGEYDEAVTYARRAIGEFSGDVRAWQRLTSALGNKGDDEQAARAMRDLLKRQHNLTGRYVDATYPFRLPEHADHFREGLRRAGWREAEGGPASGLVILDG